MQGWEAAKHHTTHPSISARQISEGKGLLWVFNWGVDGLLKLLVGAQWHRRGLDYQNGLSIFDQYEFIDNKIKEKKIIW